MLGLLVRYLVAAHLSGSGGQLLDEAGAATVARLAEELESAIATKAVEPLKPRGAGELALEVEPVIDMDGAQGVWDATFPELAGLLDARVEGA